MFIVKQKLSFDSETKKWYMYMCACLCVYTLQVIKLTTFWLGCLFVFVSMKNNSFDVKYDDFCLLKIWIFEVLLLNVTQRCVQQSCSISAHELPYEFLRILSIFGESFYCLSPVIVAVRFNVETLKRNGILFSQFEAQYCRGSFF